MTDNSDNNDGNICHILPCSIEEDITAPIAQYFHPTQLPAEALPPQNNNNKNDGSPDIAKKDDNAVTIMAAQFRGRGLLCAVDSTDAAAQEGDDKSSSLSTNTIPLSKLPPTIIGVALSQSSSSSNTTTTTTGNSDSKDPPIQSLKVVETFNKIYNWSHEHDVQKVMRERHGTDKYGLNAVLQWCDLAHEVSY